MNSFHKPQYAAASALVGLALAFAWFGQTATAQTITAL